MEKSKKKNSNPVSTDYLQDGNSTVAMYGLFQGRNVSLGNKWGCVKNG
jgi:hypothetical protein